MRLLVVDVDGVLAPTVGDQEERLPVRWSPWVPVPTDEEHNAWVSPAMGEAVKSLIDGHRLQAAWLTSWHERARQAVAPALGLGDAWPVIPWTPRLRHPQAGKAAGLARWLDAHRNPDLVVWCDDQLAPMGVLDFAVRGDDLVNPLAARDIPHLLIAPTMAEGLGDGHFDEIDRWLSGRGP